MRTPNRKHFRKGVLKRYSLSTQHRYYYSAGASVNGFVQVYDLQAKVWQGVPEKYFGAEFWRPDRE